MQTADDLFGGQQGSPRSDKLIAALVQWAEAIRRKIDNVFLGGRLLKGRSFVHPISRSNRQHGLGDTQR
jgi:hypothetical protein